jgi:polysaccharide deacetylase family protein (PEP-CTERM system associated)
MAATRTRPDRIMVTNGLSVDIEDWFQVGAFERTIRREDWDTLTPRVERNSDAVIELFERMGAKATFFTLGWVAERHPALIRRIVEAGHELASHGWDHLRVFTLTPDQFRDDLRRTRAVLEDLGGQKVTGYRAPSFSIDQRTPWAHEILAEEGYAYSSSVAPVVHDHYGWPEAPRFAFRPVADSALVELPVTTARLGGRVVAAGGGGFFRLFPYAFSRWAIRQVNREQHPAVFYFHPWEIDPGQPRVADAPLKSKLRHYARLGAMEGKLERVIRDFRWDRVDRVVAAEAAGGV